MSGQETRGSRKIIDFMLTMAADAIQEEQFERAAKTYLDILHLEPDITAQYNLGILYAQGKGTALDLKEAAYWFRQAELMGDEDAGKLCLKASMGFINSGIDQKTPERLYMDMFRFIRYVYPDSENTELDVCRRLYAIAFNHLDKKENPQGIKLLRAAAEYGNDGISQGCLGRFYHEGAIMEKNDPAALYWLDKAADNGQDDCTAYRDNILSEYKKELEPADFFKMFSDLSGDCRTGSTDIPKDAPKAARWLKVAESIAPGKSGQANE